MLFGWLLRILLIVLLIRAVLRLVQGMLEGATGRPRVTGPQGIPLVRDPVCGTFVVRSNALAISEKSGVQYFCSEECLKKYSAARLKPRATEE